MPGAGATGSISEERSRQPGAFVGRSEEVRQLLAAAESTPQVVFIEGEAGIGKTRLVAEVGSTLAESGRLMLLGACHPLADPFPLGAAIDALVAAEAHLPPAQELKPVTGVLRTLVPELAARLPDPPVRPADPRAERHIQFRAIGQLLGALPAPVLIVEDLQWADEATIELVLFLCAQPPSNLLTLVTYRRSDLREDSLVRVAGSRTTVRHPVREIRLQPFEGNEIAELVAAMLPTDDVSAEFAEYLLQRSAGIPFVVEEVLRLLVSRRQVLERDGRWVRSALKALEVPTAVKEAVLQRVAALSDEARAVADAAATLEVACDAATITAVCELDEAAGRRGLTLLLEVGLLRELGEQRIGWRHALGQQAVYEAIPAPVRIRLHEQAARELSRREPRPVTQLARHYKQAGAVGSWVDASEAAADLATSRGDHGATFRFLRDVVSSPAVPAAERARLAAKLGRSVSLTAHAGEALEILRMVLETAATAPEDRGELRFIVGRLLIQLGDAAAGRREAAAAVEDLSGRPGTAARALATLAYPWVPDGDRREHLRWMTRALETAAGEDDPLVRLALLVDRASLLLAMGDPAGWEAAAEVDVQPQGLDEHRQLVRGGMNFAHACTVLGHYGAAEAFAAQATERSHEHAAGFLAASLAGELLMIEWLRGSWAGLEERSARFLDPADEWFGLAQEPGVVRGAVLLARGDLDAAARVLEPIATTGQGGHIDTAAIAAAVLLRAEVGRGRPERALEVADAALAAVRRKDIWAWGADLVTSMVETMAAGDRADEAADLAEELRRGLTGRDSPSGHAASSFADGLVAEAGSDPGRAAAAFAEAEAAWQALPRPYEVARAAERLATVTHGDQARDAAARALDGFQRLGATWDAARARRALRRQGVRTTHGRGRRGYGPRVTASSCATASAR